MIDWLKEFLSQNEFASGGLLVVLSSSCMYLLRSIPTRIMGALIKWLGTQYTISSIDPMYEPAVAWCVGLRQRWRAVSVASSEGALRGQDSWREPSKGDKLHTSPGEGGHIVWVSGSPISINRATIEKSGADVDRYLLHVTVPVWRKAWWEKKLREFKADCWHDENREFEVHIPGMAGWNRVASPDGRPFSTVYSPASAVLEEDATQFLASHEAYRARGVPWRRGYLLHGPPGTGKTSLALALASEFKLRCFVLPLGSLESDAQLMERVGRMGENSMLVFEDIDRMDAKKVSMSGILNVIDGIASRPAGSILVMTTNNRSELDPALVRPGRIDVEIEMGPLCADSVVSMAAAWEADVDVGDWVGRTPAEFQQWLQKEAA